MRIKPLQIALLFIFYLPALHCVNITSDNADILLNFKRGMGDTRSVLSSWNISFPCSEWLGVACDNSGSVISLNLSSKSLDGNIIEAIGNLSSLQTLNFGGNNFVGSIPDSIGSLQNLTQLNLTGNNFGSVIPETICKLKKLRIFEASSCTLNGPIPSCIGNLSSLESLILSKNQFNGSLPPSLKDLPLINLDLSDFVYTGKVPSFLGEITTLKTINFLNVKFTGQIPESFCEFKALTTLVMGGSFISSLPTCISSLTKLTYLDLSESSLSGDTLSIIKELTVLEYLDLNSNSLSGEIPSELGNLANLNYLDLSKNVLRGIIPSEFGKLTKLSYLNLENNRIIGNIPSEIFSLTKLQTLKLGINILNGSIPDEIGNLKSLTELWLNSNNLTGSIPSTIGNLTKLSYLTLRYNHLEGAVPSQITNLVLLTTLQLNGNKLTSLPSNLNRLSVLNELDLSYNNFQGSIPTELTEITTLSQIFLQSNQFSGKIPDFSKLQSLSTLHLFKNNLNGSIPKSLFNIPTLQVILLNENSLSGSIPDVSNMQLLTKLVLDNNQLSGNLPADFSSLSILETFSASNNLLTGRVSASLMAAFTGSLNLANNQLSGKIPTVLITDAVINYINLENNDLQGDINQFDTVPAIKYLFLSNNAFSTSLAKLNLSKLPNLVQLCASSSSISGSLQSLKNNLNLLKLDLSSNELTGSLPPIDDSLQYIDLSGNRLDGSINFDVSNFPNGSFVSLRDNELSGIVANELYDTADIDIFLSGNPACDNSNSNACTAQPTFTNKWNYKPFCTNVNCNGDTSPNPSLYNSSARCFCSGYLQLIIELESPPFSKFEDQTVTAFQKAFIFGASSDGDNSNMFDYDSQVQVVWANQTSNAHQLLEVRVYSSDGGPLIPRYAWSIIDSMYTDIFFLGDYFGPSNLIEYNFVFRSSFTGINDSIDDRPHKKAFTSTPIFIVIIIVIALLAACIVLAAFLRYKKRDTGDVTIKVNQQLIPFIAFKVIEESTNHFSESNKIGICGTAFIYRGKTREGNLLAIKRNFDLNTQTAKDFKNEVETLSKLRNANLLRLIGYCNEFNEQISVFEFVPNGTLWDILHSSDNSYPIRFSFKQRLKIALGTVEGLSYLISSPKYHQIKHIVDSHNIFIDNNLQAVVSIIEFKPKSSSSGEGTAFKEDKFSLVYIDPQFINSGRLTTESVIYSLGIVLLELITGKKPLLEEEDITIVEWVTGLANENKLSQIVDSRLGVNYSMDSVKRLVEIALSCVEKISSNRPTLQEVARALTDIDGPIDPALGTSNKMDDSLLTSSTRSDDSV